VQSVPCCTVSGSSGTSPYRFPRSGNLRDQRDGSWAGWASVRLGPLFCAYYVGLTINHRHRGVHLHPPYPPGGRRSVGRALIAAASPQPLRRGISSVPRHQAAQVTTNFDRRRSPASGAFRTSLPASKRDSSGWSMPSTRAQRAETGCSSA
jgi:hypothetical protein